ncbi:ApaLI-like restriction endonuclease [Kordia sp. SMS9]|nr:ApaLI-like restriction endonuclease [Kordia sp. SMS9]
MEDAETYVDQQILQAKKDGTDYELLYSKIEELSNRYAETLNGKIEGRKEEMLEDDNSHYLIYRVLGISNERGQLIDVYQNTGRFLYKYAGSFLEEATVLCFKFNNLNGKRTLVNNTIGSKPKTFEIDFLDRNNAIEIKWRDATTDGDHITKEHTRVECITNYNYKPIRVMFYYPQRKQAIKIQKILSTYYKGVNGEYYGGDEAWNFVKEYTGYDLSEILTSIADKKTSADESK